MTPRADIGSLSGVEVVRESTRRLLAITALIGFLVLLTAIIVHGWIAGGTSSDDTIKLLTAVASILSGVVGTIVGFYFQAEKQGAGE